MLNMKDHILEIIYNNNLQFSSNFRENTNNLTYVPLKLYKIGLLNSFLIGLIIGKLFIFFNIIVGKFFINYVNIYILKYISRRILNISLFWKFFLLLLFIYIIIDIYQIYYNSYISFDWNLILNIYEDNNKSIVDASNSVINVQNPVTNVSIPVEAAQVVATSFSTAAGLKAGLELAKNVPNIGAKAALIVGTSIAAQAINITTNKILKSSSSSEIKTSFIPVEISQFINNNVNNIKNNEKYSEYPYNLIPDLNMYINIEIWFLIILINVLLTAYLLEKNIDINKYIKNDKLRKLLNYMYNRYISVWSVSKNLIIIWCILMLLICIFMIKLILFILLSV